MVLLHHLHPRELIYIWQNCFIHTFPCTIFKTLLLILGMPILEFAQMLHIAELLLDGFITSKTALVNEVHVKFPVETLFY